MTGAIAALTTLLALTAPSTPDTLGSGADTLEALDGAPVIVEPGDDRVGRSRGLEALVPDVARDPYRLAPGERAFLHRLSLSPAYGRLGDRPLFALRAAYNPNRWLGYEGAIGHDPGQSVHAVLHTLNAIVRRPLAGRYQPYLTAGYGMMIVFPGQSLNAASVTKNVLTAGLGLELYIRSDLAIRAELAQATVLGRQRDHDGIVAFNYLQQTIGLAFYRSIKS